MADEPVWSDRIDGWYHQVRRELRLKRQADLTMLECAAHAMHRTTRTSNPDTADLRLIVDALAALQARRRIW